MKYFFIILFLAVSPLLGRRDRHVAEEWNTNALNLESNLFGLVISWHFSPWLGAYYQTPEWWVFHCEKGWLYPESDGNKGVWFYWHKKSSWVWTREGIYPYAWDASKEAWFDFCIKPAVVAVK